MKFCQSAATPDQWSRAFSLLKLVPCLGLPDPRVLPRAGGERDIRALLRPDLRLRRDRGARLQRERQPGSDPHLHRDGLPRGEGVPRRQRGELAGFTRYVPAVNVSCTSTRVSCC